MRALLFVLTMLCLIPLYAQEIAGEEINSDSVVAWQADMFSYGGVYHFGFSEAESDLLIIVDGKDAYAQLRQWEFSDDGQSWVQTYQNFTDVRINKNRFRSAEANGEFVSCVYGEERLLGLRIDKPWSPLMTDASEEIGLKQNVKESLFEGKFSEASTQALSEEAIRLLSPEDIRIMRNEIFARYGYIFRQGGSMETYFKAQSWYKPVYKDVNPFLTDLEKKNIDLIRKVEAGN